MSTEAALAARRRSTEAALGRVRDAITRLRREKTQVSVAAVSRKADVSRTFLYSNPDARAAVADAIAAAGEQRTRILDAQDDEREATWRERALNAEDALALDMRKPQDYFQRVWSTAFRASGLAAAGEHNGGDTDDMTEACA